MKLPYKKYPITYMVIGICVAMYLYTYIRFGTTITAYEALEVGGLHPTLVITFHEYYRLVLANIIHFDIWHIFCNCYSLYTVGQVVGLERLLQTKRFLFLIICSLFFTTIVPCLLFILFDIGGNSVMAGLSGVVFGLLGAMCVLAWYFKGEYLRIFKQIKGSLICMLIVSVIVPSISLVGHLSGLLGGSIGMWIVITYFPIETWRYKKEETLQ